MSAPDASVRDRLRSLGGGGNAASLRSAIGELCAEFGNVTRIEVLTLAEAEKRHAVCFLRLESAAQEQRLIDALGASRFGDDVVVIVDLGANRQMSARGAAISRPGP